MRGTFVGNKSKVVLCCQVNIDLQVKGNAITAVDQRQSMQSQATCTMPCLEGIQSVHLSAKIDHANLQQHSCNAANKRTILLGTAAFDDWQVCAMIPTAAALDKTQVLIGKSRGA